MRSFRAILAAAVPLALVLPAGAPAQEAGETAEILGEWDFEAGPTHGVEDCTFTGQVMLSPSPTPNVYECTMVARDYCPGAWDYTAEQTCVATRKDGRLYIQSTIDAVEPPTDLYLPDNFRLEIIDAANMVGELQSGFVAMARFFRRNGPIA